MGSGDFARLALRGASAAVFMSAGQRHLKSREGTQRWLASVGYREPSLSWAAMTVSEYGAGISMLLGAGTALGAAAMNGTMTSAIGSVHRQNGWQVEKEGVEFPVVLIALATAVAALGPGKWSVDHLIGVDRRSGGWRGVALALGGIGAGMAQLAAFWERPEPKSEA